MAELFVQQSSGQTENKEQTLQAMEIQRRETEALRTELVEVCGHTNCLFIQSQRINYRKKLTQLIVDVFCILILIVVVS